MSSPPDLSLFLGRLHPLLVHLPIGLILLLGFLEAVALLPRFRQATANNGLILALAVPVSIASAGCGWLLSLGGGYQDHLLQWHKWTGVATAGFCLAAGLLYALNLKRLYRWPLVASVATLVIAGHFGASLTHGSDYLAKYAPVTLRPLLGGASAPPPAAATPKIDPAQVQIFAGVIQPIFQADCVSCHGAEKAKGKLRLDAYAAVLKGGDSGPAVIPGKPAESEMVKRLTLPPTSDDHMPPDGKPQPSPDELALVRWWIEGGAPDNRKVGELKPPDEIARILDARFGVPARVEKPALVAKAAPPKPLDQIQPVAARLADELGIVISLLSENEPWLQCNAGVAGTNFGNAELARLSPLFANLRWLDLSGTGVNDTGLAGLAAMPNLVRLHLERTHIGDAGLAELSGLSGLEYLNLYATQVTDAGLDNLRRLPKLKQLYLWRTKVTPAAAEKFASARPADDSIRKWEAEIEKLKDQIWAARITVDVGITSAVASVSEPKPMNTACPVSGKPVDPLQTVAYEGKRIAFCCSDCKAKFQKDPKPFLAKLDLAPADPAKAQAGK